MTACLRRWTLILMFAAGPLFAQQPQVQVFVSPNRIFEGESAAYHIVLSGTTTKIRPTTPLSPDYELRFVGESPRGAWFNNQVGEIVRRIDQVFEYRLIPRRTGEISIAAPTVRLGAMDRRGQEKTLTVVGPEKQNDVEAEILIEPKTAYPFQPFTVTLLIRLKALPGQFADRDPNRFMMQSWPTASLPWGLDSRLQSGIKPILSTGKWMEKRLMLGEGFRVQLAPGMTHLMRFDVEQVHRADAQGVNDAYWEYRLPRELVGVEAGKYTFGPSALKGRFFVPNLDSPTGAAPKDIFAVAAAKEIEVKNVPTKGRPDSFTGAVGNFTFQSSLNATSCKVGDPLNLTLKLQGNGLLDVAAAPQLDSMSFAREGFRLYPPTETTVGDSRIFTFAVRPTRPGRLNLPSVPIAYFDVKTERFVELHAEPIPVDVAATTAFQESTIVARAAAAKVEENNAGLYGNAPTPNDSLDFLVNPRPWFVGVGGLGVFYLTLWGASTWMRARRADPMIQKRRAAPAKARRRLQEARAALSSGDIRRGVELAHAAFVGAVEDYLAIPAAGLTPTELQDTLASQKIAEPAPTRIADLLARMEELRFGASPHKPEALWEEAVKELESLLVALKRGAGR